MAFARKLTMEKMNSKYKLLAVITLSLIGPNLFANGNTYLSTSRPSLLSAERQQNETYAQAVHQFKSKLSSFGLLSKSGTPLDFAKPVDDIDYSKVPVLTSYKELVQIFNKVRDDRSLFEQGMPSFPRRVSWLYPQDGCFARAAVEGSKMDQFGFTRGYKLFAFGNLSVKTHYAPGGEVNWWYHVSTILGVENKGYYVLDPAINPNSPTPVKEWYSLMGDTHITGVVCNKYTYSPANSCYESTESADQEGFSDEKYFLQLEWNNVENLGYDPDSILGNNPPWFLPAGLYKQSCANIALNNGTLKKKCI